MSDAEIRTLFGFLTARPQEGIESEDHVLKVQDGGYVGLLLGASDHVNYLSEDDFVQLWHAAVRAVMAKR